MSGESKGKINAMTKGLSRRSLMTATALASMAALAGCGGGDGVAAPPVVAPPPPVAPPITSKFLYTANNGSVLDTIGAYSIQASTGTLSVLPSPIGAMTDPQWLAMHSSGKWLYSSAGTALNCYAVDQSTGALTLQLTSPTVIPAPTLGGFNAIEFHPTLNVLYVADGAGGNINTYSMDSATGALTLLTLTMTGHYNNESPLIKVHPTGKFIYITYPAISRVFAYALSGSGTATTQIIDGTDAVSGASGGAVQLAFNASGSVVYAGASSGPAITGYAVNTTTGIFATATSVSGSTVSQFTLPTRLVTDPSGRYLYVDDSSQVSAYAIGSAGALSFIGSVAVSGLSLPTALAVNASGTVLYAAVGDDDFINAYSIGTTGALTAIGNLATGDNPVSIAIANF